MNSGSFLLMIGGGLLFLTILTGSFLGFDWLKQQRDRRKKLKELKALLNGRSLRDTLYAAPYKYAYFQGDDGFRIWDNRRPGHFLYTADTPLDAEIWIVKKYQADLE